MLLRLLAVLQDNNVVVGVQEEVTDRVRVDPVDKAPKTASINLLFTQITGAGGAARRPLRKGRIRMIVVTVLLPGLA
jgi:hypothetical protein